MRKSSKPKISDEKIIKLYSAGWSINDIVAHYATTVIYVRALLQEMGAATSKYRATTDYYKNCILAVMSIGVSVRALADIIDVSSHLIRQVLRSANLRAEDLRQNASFDVSEQTIPEVVWSRFNELYVSGQYGFIKCAETCGFSATECAQAVVKLTEQDVKQHQKNLTSHIASKQATGLSPTSIGKQFGVSTSLVKQIFKNVS